MGSSQSTWAPYHIRSGHWRYEETDVLSTVCQGKGSSERQELQLLAAFADMEHVLVATTTQDSCRRCKMRRHVWRHQVSDGYDM